MLTREDDGTRVERYGNVAVYIDPAGWVVTSLSEDRLLYANPIHDEECRARAASLGYPDVEAMTREHDPMHSRLAHALGLSESPALSRAADGLPPCPLTDAEECMVLAAQRFLNLCRANGLVVEGMT